MSGPYREPDAPAPQCKHSWRVVTVHHAFEVSLMVRCHRCGVAPLPGGVTEVATLLLWHAGIGRG